MHLDQYTGTNFDKSPKDDRNPISGLKNFSNNSGNTRPVMNVEVEADDEKTIRCDWGRRGWGRYERWNEESRCEDGVT